MSGRSRHPIVWIAGGLATVLTVIVAWFVIAHLEIEEREVAVPPRGEALRNPLLAAERLTRELGLPARSAASVDPLPPPSHVLVYGVPSRVLSGRRVERLVAWVESGGFLVVSPYLEFGEPTEETARDPLLGEIDAWVDVIEADDSRTVYQVPVGDEGAELDVQMLDAVGLYEGEGEQALFWVRRALGRGTVVMLNDLEFVRNDRIGAHDHAEFLWWVLNSAGPREGVLFVHDEGRASIVALLVRTAPVAVAAALALLGLWTLRVATRFGPVRPPPLPARRALMEHVDALGRFLWRHGRQDALLERVRHDVERTIAARRPVLLRGGTDARVATIAETLKLEPATVRRALFDACPEGRRGWIETMKCLQTMRSRL